MSKQRFLGGLLGANPLRAGSFTDTAITGSIVDAQGIFLGGATGNFTVTGDDIVHNVTSQFDILFADLTGYTGKYYCEAYLYGPHGRAGTLTSSISSFTGNTYGILGSQSGHVGILPGSTYNVLVDGTSNSVMSATLDGTQYHLVVGFAFDFDNDELTISLTDPFIDGTQTWVTSAFGTSTTFPASATVTRAGVTDRLAVGEFSTVYDGVIFNFGDNPTFSGNLPTGCSTDSSEWCRDAPTAYDGKFGITVGSTDRTTSNVGVVALDEAGPEATLTAASATYSGTFAATDSDFTLVAVPYHTQAKNTGSWKNRSFSEALTGTNKYYCEIHVPAAANNIMIGVANSSLPSTSYAGQSGNNGISFYSSNGNYYYGGAGTSYGSAWNSGAKTIGMAIDMDAREIWWSIDGTWQNSSDPSAGTGGIAMAGNIASGDVFINVADNSGGTPDFHLNTGENGTFNGVLTAGGNTDTNGLGDFKYTVPTGFSVTAAVTPGETRELTQMFWGGIRGRDVVESTAASGDANWNDVVLLLDGSSLTTKSSNSVTATENGYTSQYASMTNVTGPHQTSDDVYTFDGSNDKLTVPDSSIFDFGSSDWTIECWVYCDNLSTGRGVFSKRANSDSSYRWIVAGISTNGTINTQITTTGSSWQINTNTTSTVSVQTWTHLAWVRNGSDVSVYVNGVKNTLSSSFSGSIYKDTEPMAIGASGNSGTYFLNWMHGYIDDFRITKNVARDIAADWTAGVYNSALPQGASVAASTSLANTGILSLSELLQASYGAAVPWDGSGAEILLVAGGGGGGGVVTGSANIGGGGGGAGAYYPLSAQTFALNTSYTFTVGAGGAGNTGAGQGSNGGATTLVGGSFNLSSPGGGGGGAFGSAASNGASGGSGGGAGWNSTGGSSTAGAGQYGNAGGSTSGLSKAGGGGGAGSAGAISGSNYDGADGGSGKTWAIDGVALAGGGGAGGWQGQGTGYIGQGQDGGANGSGGTATANTGGGGGGGRRAATEAGTDGASGVIKVWVPQAGYSGYTAGTPANVTASAVTYSGTAGTLLTVTGTTTITFS